MASQRLEEGAVLADRYEILEIVGRGGMGTVYRALDSRLDIVVAIKEMSERFNSAEDRDVAVRQFQREAKLLGQLHHPNLPKVTDYFVHGDRCYLVMEFVQGKTLESLLKEARGTALPLPDVLSWGVQLADTLAYLHSQDPPIVFRDVKPANIMVEADGAIKLIDFGIARRFQEGATKDTLLYGSPGYSPPEQYGRSQTDPRSDLYALGATLHHLVTGRDPAPSPFKFPSIRSLDPALPPALDAFISRCVEMEENKRIQTAEEAEDILVQVRAAVNAQPQIAAQSPTGSPPKTGPKVLTRRRSSFDQTTQMRKFALGAAGVIVIFVLAVATYKLRATAPHNAVAVPPPSNGSARPADPQQTTTEDGTGRLQINSSPEGARVVLDGKTIGNSPMDAGDLPAGKHSLRLIPNADSGLSEYSRELEVHAGETLVVDATLPAAPGSSTAGTFGTPLVQIQDARALPIIVHPGMDPQIKPGLRIGVDFRVSGAAGKTGVIGAFFFGLDKATPLRPRIENTQFQNSEGQLSVAQSFTCSNDPNDFPNTTLFVPEEMFPTTYDQITWRIIVYVEGKQVYQSPVASILQSGP